MNKKQLYEKTKSTDFDSHLTKRLSVIIATKNRADKLDKALQNVREYLTPEDELLVIDGNSTDATKDVVEKHRDIIDLYVSEADTYGGEAANKGLLLSRGKYIRYVSDDDYTYPEGIRKAVEVLEKNPSIDLLLCGGIKEKNHIRYPYLPPSGCNFGKDPTDVLRFKGSTGAGWVIRRKALAIIGLVPARGQSVIGDMAFVANAIKGGASVKFCRIKLYFHEINKESQGVRHPKETMRSMVDIGKNLLPFNELLQLRLSIFLREEKMKYPILKKPIGLLENKLGFFLAGWKNRKPETIDWDGEFC